MLRTSFNGGVLGRGMSLRLDTDIHSRGLTTCENFVIEAMGGVRRRRGFRFWGYALDQYSRLFPYVYSSTVSCFIQISETAVQVHRKDGLDIAWIEGHPWAASQIDELRVAQVKKLLIITHPLHPPYQLQPLTEDLREWTLTPYELAHEPWRYSGIRDTKVTLLHNTGTPYDFNIRFSDGEPDTQFSLGDIIRVNRAIEAQDYDIPKEAGIFPSEEGVPCGGTWQLLVSGTRGCKLIVQRQFPKGEWHDLSASISVTTSPTNNVLTGDASSQECRLRVVSSNVDGTWSDWTQRLVIDGYTREQRLQVTEDKRVLFKSATYQFPSYFVSNGFQKKYLNLDVPVRVTQGAKTWLGFGFVTSKTIKLLINGDESIDWDAPLSIDIRQEAIDETFTTGADLNNAVYAPSTSTIDAIELTDSFGTGWFRRIDMTASIETVSWQEEAGDYWRVGDKPELYTFPNSRYCRVLAGRITVPETWMPAVEDKSYIASEGYGNEGARLRLLNDIREPEPAPDSEYTTSEWSWAAWSSTYGYPAICGLHQQRLYFAGSPAQPQTIWMTRTDDIANFATSLLDDGAIVMTLATSNESEILWAISKGHDLLVGTSSAEFVISAAQGGVLTASSAMAYPDGYVGSSNLTPALATLDQVLYIERGAGRLRQLGFSEQVDGYVSQDLTVYNPDILADGGGVVSITTASKPDVAIYCVLADGSIAAMTYNPIHSVAAWYKMTTQGQVKCATVLPDGTNSDIVFMVVSRVNNYGQTEYFIETYSDKSQYADNQYSQSKPLDYTSTLITTDIQIGSVGNKNLSASSSLYFAYETGAEGIETTSSGGEEWAPLNAQGVVPKGWHVAYSQGSYPRERNYGFRVSGNRDLYILGLKINPSE